ncbi:trimethylamine methyltransferase family protein [candidate division KSB1 bacterium]
MKFLSDELIKQIISEAVEIICKLGLEIHNKNVLTLISDHGAAIDKQESRVTFTEEMVENALKTAPESFRLYDVNENETHNFCGFNVYFTPGSAALNILDYKTKKIRKPFTDDYISYLKVISQLEHIASQSTAFIPSDVNEKISDSYRLFLSLLYCEKPVVTGAFSIDSFNLMKDFQVTVRGTEETLKEKPLTIFSCCPSSPLRWSDVTSQNILDCAKYSIPVEFISMPLSGFVAPITMTGTLIQHTAETLSGLIISQLSNPGTPIIYGGSPAIFDMRYETTPMGAVETMMIDCAYNEIGKYLKLPTQAYISLSDSKKMDTQAGIESGIGATLAALSGINNISGPGMLDFENCQSLEKLVVDNEICGMTYSLIKGITPKDDFPSISRFEELIKEGHLIISEHTTRYLKEEHYYPGPVIDRSNRIRFEKEVLGTLEERAHDEVEKLLKSYRQSTLSEEIKKELIKLMEKEAKRCGQGTLPERK